MGMACLMAERQQVDQMCDHKQPRGHPKRHWQDDLERGYRSKLEPCCQRSTLMDKKQRGVPQTGVKQNPDDDIRLLDY